MSMSRHCKQYKATNGKWYMELGNYEYHFEEDREPFSVYGPFASAEAADRELERHSNPGGLHIDDSGQQSPPENPISRQRSRWIY